MEEEQIRQLKVTELRAELSKLDLPTTGKKDELIARLIEALHSTKPCIALSPSSPKNSAPSTPIASNNNNITSPNPKSPKTVNEGASTAAARAERFNLPLHEQVKKEQRKERFGVTSSSATSAEAASVLQFKKIGSIDGEALEIDRLRARQERFGVITSTRLMKEDDLEAKHRRAERFTSQ